ncbi:MAG: hypothetical protein WB626_12405 [Bacteroidota bacterium]
MGLTVVQLADAGDDRGSSFSLPRVWNAFLPPAQDAHITTILPGQTRGNHFHPARREVIVLLYRDAWTLAWDAGEGTEVHRRDFAGGGAALLLVEAGAAHAITNTGARDLVAVALRDKPYDPAHPDTVPRDLHPAAPGPRGTKA